MENVIVNIILIKFREQIVFNEKIVKVIVTPSHKIKFEG